MKDKHKAQLFICWATGEGPGALKGLPTGSLHILSLHVHIYAPFSFTLHKNNFFKNASSLRWIINSSDIHALHQYGVLFFVLFCFVSASFLLTALNASSWALSSLNFSKFLLLVFVIRYVTYPFRIFFPTCFASHTGLETGARTAHLAVTHKSSKMLAMIKVIQDNAS